MPPPRAEATFATGLLQHQIAKEREMGLQTMTDAKAHLEVARADVEAMIVGTKPVY